MKTTIAMAFTALMTMCAPAHAQSNCAPYEVVEGRLGSQYEESLVWRGLGSDNTMVSLFSNPETETWTIVVVQPNGTACLVAAGQSSGMVEAEPLGDDA